MMMLYLFVAFIVMAEAKFYKDCGSKLAQVKHVEVTGCKESAKECVLKRGTNVTFTIDLKTKAEVQTVETLVHGILMNLPVPFPLPQPDACKDSGLTCPLKAGTEAHYVTSLPVLKTYPTVKVDVQWELKNEDNVDLVCILIPARLA